MRPDAPHLMQTYARQPIAFARGEGAWLYDTDGRRYLDAIAGVGVCVLGHAHPELAEALAEQARMVLHTSNLYRIPAQELLAEQLAAVTGMDRVFFCNSGAEANEAAIKLARLHGHRRGIDTPAIVVAEGSFHGRTLATLSATGSRKVQAGFEPLVPGFIRVPYGDLEALEAVARSRRDVAAVLLEPIQGEGGVVVPPRGYLRGVGALCEREHWLLMLDEVQTGVGRTGTWLAAHQEHLLPDVVTVAKGLGNGIPIGACLARGEAATLFTPGSHGSTFGGSPFACVAAGTVLRVLAEERLAERAMFLGDRMLRALRERLGERPGVQEVRGRGLMIGVELDRPCAEVVDVARADGLLVNVTAGRVVRLLPPLILTPDEAEQVVDGTVRAIDRVLGD